MKQVAVKEYNRSRFGKAEHVQSHSRGIGWRLMQYINPLSKSNRMTVFTLALMAALPAFFGFFVGAMSGLWASPLGMAKYLLLGNWFGFSNLLIFGGLWGAYIAFNMIDDAVAGTVRAVKRNPIKSTLTAGAILWTLSKLFAAGIL